MRHFVFRPWAALLTAALVSTATFSTTWAAPAAKGGTATTQRSTAETPRAVLVTGASSGIGRKITEHLAERGYFVYAGARKEADLEALGKLKNVQPVRLDVTKAEDIAAAVTTIIQAGRGLYGLVNNAGIATLGPILGPIQGANWKEIELTMEVNVYGPYRMSQAFAPLIAAGKGRITTIGSISGFLAGANGSVYSMSKHAVEAFTDSLAQEMAPLGVQVSVIEPGNYNSEIGRNAEARTGVDVGRFADRSRFKEPDEVAEAAGHALFDAHPKRRYMVVPNQREAEITLRKQIERLVQLNEGQPYTYDRDALVKMLDEALENARPRTGGTEAS